MTIKSMLTNVMALLTLTLSLSLSADDGAAGQCLNHGIITIDFYLPDSTVSGNANLCKTVKGVNASVRTAGLVPGHAYTAWWAYVDDASLCEFGPGFCAHGPADYAGDKPITILGRLGSAVAGVSGAALLHGNWGGMSPSSGSEIQIFILDHGPAANGDGDALARQTLTPEDPFLGVPFMGNNVDGWLGIPVGFAVFTYD
jgi:hypothetical protein